MFEARHFCEGASIVEVLSSLRGARDRVEARLSRGRGDDDVGAYGTTAELRVGDDERDPAVRREHAVHRFQCIRELFLPVALGVRLPAPEVAS